jgi:LuxR family transcriptional regulator, maltose regulon positive regulatory protein
VEATVDELVCPSLIDEVRGSTGSLTELERCVAEGLFLTKGRGAETSHGSGGTACWPRTWAYDGGSRSLGPERGGCALPIVSPVDPAVTVAHGLAARDGEARGCQPTCGCASGADLGLL